MENLIKLKGLSKRGENRIKEHGITFTLIKDVPESNCGHIMLVESLEPTCHGGTWLGWFEVGKEVEIVDGAVNKV